MISTARMDWIDQLVESGLTSINRLPYARIVMLDVPTGITNMVYRNLAIEIWGKIGEAILSDPVLFQRLRQLISQKYQKTTLERPLSQAKRTLRTIRRITR